MKNFDLDEYDKVCRDRSNYRKDPSSDSKKNKEDYIFSVPIL